MTVLHFLDGLPLAVKDLMIAAGGLTTFLLAGDWFARRANQ